MKPPELSFSIRKARPEDTGALVKVWAEAVAATHHFLAREEFEYYRRRIPQYLQAVEVYVAEREAAAEGDLNRNNSQGIKGFSGVADGKLEMLFVGERGTGIGTALLNHAVNELGITKVDVNEENPQAAGFYRAKGFTETGRSPLDGEGKPHPIIHMELKTGGNAAVPRETV